MNKNFLLLLVILVSTACSSSSKISKPTSIEEQTKFAQVINETFLKKHLAIIAADDMEGRETGTAGQRKAAAYIESQFKEMGLLPPAGQKSYQQLYPLYTDSLISANFLYNTKKATLGTDYIPMLTNNTGNKKVEANKIIFVGYGIEDALYSDYSNNTDYRNAIVAFINGEPKKDVKYFLAGSDTRSEWTASGVNKKIAIAKKKGAVGAIVINTADAAFDKRLVDRNKKTNQYFPNANTETSLPIAMFSKAYLQTIAGDRLDIDKYLTVSKTSGSFTEANPVLNGNLEFSVSKFQETTNASNVLGVIKGKSKPDEVLFITGHYDHLGIRNGIVYNGADDDGSGTVGVMNMAAAFMEAKKAGNGPDRTIVFMTVSGEEKGLWGSEYYSDHPLYPLDKTTVNLNIDMIGRVDTERTSADTLNYVYVIGHDKLSSDLQTINELANKNSSNITLDYKYDDPNDKNRIYFRSDHYNFARKGVPILFFYDGMLKSDYHKATDDIEKINFELYKKRAQMIFFTAWDIANREDMLKRDIPLSMSTR